MDGNTRSDNPDIRRAQEFLSRDMRQNSLQLLMEHKDRYLSAYVRVQEMERHLESDDGKSLQEINPHEYRQCLKTQSKNVSDAEASAKNIADALSNYSSEQVLALIQQISQQESDQLCLDSLIFDVMRYLPKDKVQSLQNLQQNESLSTSSLERSNSNKVRSIAKSVIGFVKAPHKPFVYAYDHSNAIRKTIDIPMKALKSHPIEKIRLAAYDKLGGVLKKDGLPDGTRLQHIGMKMSSIGKQHKNSDEKFDTASYDIANFWFLDSKKKPSGLESVIGESRYKINIEAWSQRLIERYKVPAIKRDTKFSGDTSYERLTVYISPDISIDEQVRDVMRQFGIHDEEFRKDALKKLNVQLEDLKKNSAPSRHSQEQEDIVPQKSKPNTDQPSGIRHIAKHTNTTDQDLSKIKLATGQATPPPANPDHNSSPIDVRS